MTTDEFEQDVRQVAAQWIFVRQIATVDKTDYAIKMRLDIDSECFIQVYTNVQKELLSFALILNRSRIYGRDNDGGAWHRHPYQTPAIHDFSDEGARTASLTQFLAEAQQILQDEEIL